MSYILSVSVGSKQTSSSLGFVLRCVGEEREARQGRQRGRMREGTSSRSHERRARGGGEASLMKRTPCLCLMLRHMLGLALSVWLRSACW